MGLSTILSSIMRTLRTRSFQLPLKGWGLEFVPREIWSFLLTLGKDWFVFLHLDLNVYSQMIAKKPKRAVHVDSTPRNIDTVSSVIKLELNKIKPRKLFSSLNSNIRPATQINLANSTQGTETKVVLSSLLVNTNGMIKVPKTKKRWYIAIHGKHGKIIVYSWLVSDKL